MSGLAAGMDTAAHHGCNQILCTSVTFDRHALLEGTMSSVLDRTASSSSQAPQQLADAAPSAGGRTNRRATHRRGGWIILRFVELSITL
jgi:hypothetical protein